MLDTIMSVLTGGATGLLGTVVSGAIDFFQSRAEHKREMDLRRLDIELAQTEAGAAEKVAAIEAEGVRDAAELEAMEASYREASSRMSRAGDLYAGSAKTDPRDAWVLADYARRNPDRLVWTEIGDELLARLRGACQIVCVRGWVHHGFIGLGSFGWGSGFRVGSVLFSSRGFRFRGFLLSCW